MSSVNKELNVKSFKTNWTRIKRSIVAFAEAVEGTSSYPYERIEQLQRELAVVRARQDAARETPPPRERLQNSSQT